MASGRGGDGEKSEDTGARGAGGAGADAAERASSGRGYEAVTGAASDPTAADPAAAAGLGTRTVFLKGQKNTIGMCLYASRCCHQATHLICFFLCKYHGDTRYHSPG